MCVGVVGGGFGYLDCQVPVFTHFSSNTEIRELNGFNKQTKIKSKINNNLSKIVVRTIVELKRRSTKVKVRQQTDLGNQVAVQ